jgi:predicted outer membrane protein
MITRNFVLGCLAAVLISAPVFAQEKQLAPSEKTKDLATKDETAHNQSHEKLTIDGVLNKLHNSNVDKIALGELAVEKGESDEVKQFGRALIADHRAADAAVTKFAKKENVELRGENATLGKSEKEAIEGAPGKGKAVSGDDSGKSTEKAAKEDNAEATGKGIHSAECEKAFNELKAKSGADFDRAFSKKMAEGHDKSVEMLNRVKQNQSLAAIHPLIDELKPTFEKHAKLAHDLEMKVNQRATAAVTK